MTRRIISLVWALPPIMRIGLLILVVGGALDLLYHAAPHAWAMELDPYLGLHGASAHVVTLIGMVVTLLGLPVRRRATQSADVAEITPERR